MQSAQQRRLEASPMMQLPTALLASILQHTPLAQRMGRCSLVCKQWASAAVMATVSIDSTDGIHTSKLPALQAWLQEHGQQVASLKVSRRSIEDGCLCLPCAQLLQLSKLDLSGHVLKLQLPSTGSNQRSKRRSSKGNGSSTLQSAAAAPMLPKLVEFKLSLCTLGTTSPLTQLANLTTLTKLDLSNVSMADSCKQPVKQLSKAVAKVLQHLPLLHRVWMWQLQLDESAFAPLSSMQHLQDCSLWCASTSAGAVPSANVLPHLPQQLTSLGLGDSGTCSRRKSWRQQLSALSGLQDLSVDCIKIHPSVLSNMPHMTSLDFEFCRVLGGVDGAAAFLAAVGGMQQLERLSCEHMNFGSLASLPAQQFTGFNLSTQLRYLVLETWSDQLFPPGAVSRVFPPGKQFPNLVTVSFRSDSEPCMTSKDLCSLLKGCPALSYLSLRNMVLPGCVGALLLLPSRVHGLDVGGKVFDDSAAGTVCQLTQIKELEWHKAPGLTDVGLEKLTALTGLTSLTIIGCDGLSQQAVPRSESAYIYLGIEEHDGKPVWMRLRDVCDASPVCAPARVEQLKQRVAELKARVAELEQQQQQPVVAKTMQPAAAAQRSAGGGNRQL